MEMLNRNNANIKKILNKKVAVVCPTKEKELDFRKWAKQYVDCVDDEYAYTYCYSFGFSRKDVCILLENDGLKWEYVECFKNNDYDIFEWEVEEEEEEEEKTYTIKDVIDNEGKIYRTTTNNYMVLYSISRSLLQHKKHLQDH